VTGVEDNEHEESNIVKDLSVEINNVDHEDGESEDKVNGKGKLYNLHKI
jgi:hypothetical protein